jgi:class 3 adenylate cyclase
LSEYAGRFAENGIDISVFPDLTEQDLKDVGVLLGHRRKMLRAISELAGTGTTMLPPAPEPNQEHDAERRQVTVMFIDLVGSTALSARMDPGDLREVISAYQRCVTEAVRRFDGFLAKYMGDGVLVYFGYPKAHEDDAERAVRAGLELIAAVTGLEIHASLQTRFGIATGLVVVGDLIGSGEAQERGIIGETPNVAARLQAIAEPDSVVIAESTRKQLGNLFELQDLGVRDLKGLAGPARAWTVLRRSSIESRFEAFAPRRDAVRRPGRGVRVAAAALAASQVRSRTCGGPHWRAGIGKSRIIVALRASARRSAYHHVGARGTIHPRRLHDDYAWCRLDVNNPAVGRAAHCIGVEHGDHRADASDNGLQLPPRHGQNEREMALGRKNHLFAGSDGGGTGWQPFAPSSPPPSSTRSSPLPTSRTCWNACPAAIQ